MSYRTEELLRKGKLAALRDELHQVEIKINRLLEELRTKAFPLDGVENVDSEAIVQTSTELAEKQNEFLIIKEQIKALGG